MITMQSNEIKANLSAVLRKVESGEEIEITRHGIVVAYLTPAVRRHSSLTTAIEQIRQLKGSLRLKPDENIGDVVAQWKVEGRH